MAFTHLLAVPLKNQRAEATSDHAPPENANNDCVVTSLAAGLEFLLGRPFNGDQIKDANPRYKHGYYGQGYQGLMDPANFVEQAAALGVHMHLIPGDTTQLVATLHREIANGHPALVTVPFPVGTQGIPKSPGSPELTAPPHHVTHVCCACGEGPDLIRAMDPWVGRWQDQDDAWWRERLCYGKVWVLEKVGAGVPAAPQPDASGGAGMLNLSDALVAQYYEASGDGWRCKETGFDVRGDVLTFYRSLALPHAGLMLGLPRSNELYDPSRPHTSFQVFTNAIIVWDPNGILKGVAGNPIATAGSIYFGSLDLLKQLPGFKDSFGGK